MADFDQNSRQYMQDAEVIASLDKNGDGLSKARTIRHWAYFKSAGAATQFAAEADKLNLMVEDMQ